MKPSDIIRPVRAYVDVSDSHPWPVVGALTGATLRRSAGMRLFRPSRNLDAGEFHHLTWDAIRPTAELGFSLQVGEITFATAEGAVGLAACVGALQSRRIPCGVNVVSDTAGWAAGFGLHSLSDLSGFDQPSTGRNNIVPVYEILVGEPETCAFHAGEIETVARAMLVGAKDVHVDAKSTAAGLVALEGLLNVAEHAYETAGTAASRAYVSLSITRAPLPSEVTSDSLFTDVEVDWFGAFPRGRLFLEIAIGDNGWNIPFTLARQFKAQFPHEYTRLAGSRAPHQRAELHREIALWSFDHRSTSKTTEAFASEIARLNWRGLHTALRRAADYDGALTLHTGQTRVGYICRRGEPVRFASDAGDVAEFPGTVLTLRIPIDTVVGRPRRPRGSSDHVAVEHVVPLASLDKLTLAVGGVSAGATIGVVTPFVRLQSLSDSTQLRVQMEAIPPHIVPVFLLCDVTRTADVGLAAYETAVGPPRLAGLASPGAAIQWKFIGVYPQRVGAFVRAIEEQGHALVQPDEMAFAESLARAYPAHFVLTGNSFDQLTFSARVPDEVIHSAVQTAFDEWYRGALPNADVRRGDWFSFEAAVTSGAISA
jgi:hypothetical protein